MNVKKISVKTVLALNGMMDTPYDRFIISLLPKSDLFLVSSTETGEEAAIIHSSEQNWVEVISRNNEGVSSEILAEIAPFVQREASVKLCENMYGRIGKNKWTNILRLWPGSTVYETLKGPSVIFDMNFLDAAHSVISYFPGFPDSTTIENDLRLTLGLLSSSAIDKFKFGINSNLHVKGKCHSSVEVTKIKSLTVGNGLVLDYQSTQSIEQSLTVAGLMAQTFDKATIHGDVSVSLYRDHRLTHIQLPKNCTITGNIRLGLVPAQPIPESFCCLGQIVVTRRRE